MFFILPSCQVQVKLCTVTTEPSNGSLLFQTGAAFLRTLRPQQSQQHSLTRCLLLRLLRLFNHFAAFIPANRFNLSLLYFLVADVLCSSVWVTSSASLWHIKFNILARCTCSGHFTSNLHPNTQRSVQGHRRWYVTSASIKKARRWGCQKIKNAI